MASGLSSVRRGSAPLSARPGHRLPVPVSRHRTRCSNGRGNRKAGRKSSQTALIFRSGNTSAYFRPSSAFFALTRRSRSSSNSRSVSLTASTMQASTGSAPPVARIDQAGDKIACEADLQIFARPLCRIRVRASDLASCQVAFLIKPVERRHHGRIGEPVAESVDDIADTDLLFAPNFVERLAFERAKRPEDRLTRRLEPANGKSR